MQSAQEGCRIAIAQRSQRACDGLFAPNELIAFDGVIAKQLVVHCKQLRDELVVTAVCGKFGSLGDEVVVAVAKRQPQSGNARCSVGVAQPEQRRELRLEPVVRRAGATPRLACSGLHRQDAITTTSPGDPGHGGTGKEE